MVPDIEKETAAHPESVPPSVVELVPEAALPEKEMPS
jgi:hypothetical protein